MFVSSAYTLEINDGKLYMRMCINDMGISKNSVRFLEMPDEF